MTLLVDTQLEAMGNLIAARLNHGLTSPSACRAIVLHELIGAPPHNRFPLLVLHRKSWLYEPRGNQGKLVKKVTVGLEYYLAQVNREAYADAAARLIAADEAIDEVLRRGEHEDWVDGTGARYKLGDDFGVRNLIYRSGSLAYGTATEQGRDLFPALLVELEMWTEYTSFAEREGLTRIDGLLTWDGVTEGTYGWHVGPFRVVCTPPT